MKWNRVAQRRFEALRENERLERLTPEERVELDAMYAEMNREETAALDAAAHRSARRQLALEREKAGLEAEAAGLARLLAEHTRLLADASDYLHQLRGRRSACN